MKSLTTFFITGMVLCGPAVAQEALQGAELASKLKSSVVFKSKDSLKDSRIKLSDEDMKWWTDAKFGMFIHWGLYAIPARGEWVMHNEKIPADTYAKLADEFAPKHFDGRAWAQAAKDAGMKYMVLTARHHDGFALWDSPASYGGFCSMKRAAKRDLVREYVDGCRNAGLKVGLYYSPMDWRFPGYFDPKGLPDDAALMKAQGYGQMKELMSNYGSIDVVWYDGGWLAHTGTDADAAWFWEPVKLNKMVRELQPKAVINPRSGWEGDFQCDEGGHEIFGPIIEGPWEKCLNLNTPSWGYNTKQKPMTPQQIVQMLINVVGRGGNVLLNVGPDRDGVIPPSHVQTLRQVGDWLDVNGKGIYGTRPGPVQPLDRRYCTTYHKRSIYVHVLDWGPEKKLTLPALEQVILSASVLGGGNISCDQDANGVTLTATNELTGNGFPDVVELMLDREIPNSGQLVP
ncbi:MAG: alpha-L-fucosidase [Akkermansiaceae bacterium]